jgi:hypothetical protein
MSWNLAAGEGLFNVISGLDSDAIDYPDGRVCEYELLSPTKISGAYSIASSSDNLSSLDASVSFVLLAPEPVRKRSPLASAAIWIGLWIACFEIAFRIFQPLQYFETPWLTFASDDPVGLKVAQLQSPVPFDNLILSSSLGNQLSLADFDGRIPRITALPADYTKAIALDRALLGAGGINCNTINMSFAGGYISEQLLLFEEALSSGHKPKLLLLLLAPRDFIAKSMQKRIYKYIARRADPSRSFTFGSNPMNDFALALESCELLRQRQHIETILQLYACAGWHRAPDTYYATHTDEYWRNFKLPKIKLPSLLPQDPAEEERIRRRRVHNNYTHEYMPFNHEMYAVQKSRLQVLLAGAQKAGVETVVVNMPRTMANGRLLPDEFNSEFVNMLARASSEHHARFIDFNGTPVFSDADFEDDVHLTWRGAQKFITALSERLTSNDKESDRLK